MWWWREENGVLKTNSQQASPAADSDKWLTLFYRCLINILAIFLSTAVFLSFFSSTRSATPVRSMPHQQPSLSSFVSEETFFFSRGKETSRTSVDCFTTFTSKGRRREERTTRKNVRGWLSYFSHPRPKTSNRLPIVPRNKRYVSLCSQRRRQFIGSLSLCHPAFAVRTSAQDNYIVKYFYFAIFLRPFSQRYVFTQFTRRIYTSMTQGTVFLFYNTHIPKGGGAFVRQNIR